MMCANGRNEEIEAPHLWWCEDPNVEPEPEHIVKRLPVNLRKESKPKRPVQLSLL
jgi:hypothetical protein